MGAAEPVEPVIDADYIRSWDGVRLAAEMRKAAMDDELDDGSKLYYIVEYYSHVVRNIDEVVESLGGGSVDASSVFAYLNEYMAAKAKN